MKIISIIFDDYLANWITGCSQKNKITVSKFIRDLLYEKMQQGPVEFNYNNIKRSNKYSQINRSEMGYIIFTAKLLEKFILANEEQGQILRNLAFEETENLLNHMNFNNKKQRICISIENMLFTWLSSEATRLQLKVIPLIRWLIESSFMQNNLTTNVQSLSDPQKIAMKHQITSCKLLEKLVNQTVDDASKVIDEAWLKTDNMLLKLFPEQTV
jgi:hypothetical protein